MNEEQTKQLIAQLAWYDCSAVYNQSVKELLKECFPDSDFTGYLETFKEDIRKKGKGSPRI
jgi:hypothetical protein